VIRDKLICQPLRAIANRLPQRGFTLRMALLLALLNGLVYTFGLWGSVKLIYKLRKEMQHARRKIR
jgi:hypothetical protein